MSKSSSPPKATSRQDLALAALTWASAFGLMLRLDGMVELANLALLLVLAAAVAGWWLSVWASLLSSALAVLAFAWLFVPPRFSFTVDHHPHALLLFSMLSLCSITALLMGRSRRQTAQARLMGARAEQLRAFSDSLRDVHAPQSLAPLLHQALDALRPEPVQLLVLKNHLPPRNDAEAALWLGPEADADQATGLWLCLRDGRAFGPGTGRHQDLKAWFLPLRGRHASYGAALLHLPAGGQEEPGLRAHAQSLCDQMGLALERQATEQTAQRARDEASSQATRNALLAAISHDYRTPLACIMGAASSLLEQDARLDARQRQRLAATILDEIEALRRMTDNSLQLARLDAPGVTLSLDWESAEEIIGGVLRRSRQRRATVSETESAPSRLRARVEPELPLLRCDAVLLSQLLDNLVDNALKYGAGSPVEILARSLPWPEAGPRQGEPHIVLSVRDRGPGVSRAWQDRIFNAFQRGAETQSDRPDGSERRGAGVGLAACRAIALAHGGAMRYRARAHGGASFECWLPVQAAPSQAQEAVEP